MPQLTSLTVAQLLDAFASNDPLPAGGSAAALTGALGASVLLMVATLPRTRSGAADEATLLATAAVRLRALREELASLVQHDTDAYASLLDALRSPRGTDAERARRQDGIAAAIRLATDTPLATMRAARAALRDAVVLANHGSGAAGGDVAAAAELLRATVRAAGCSVASNLAALKAGGYVEQVDEERRTLERDAATDADRVRDLLRT